MVTHLDSSLTCRRCGGRRLQLAGTQVPLRGVVSAGTRAVAKGRLRYRCADCQQVFTVAATRRNLPRRDG